MLSKNSIFMDNYTFNILNKTNTEINIQVIDFNSIIFEKNITQNDLPNNFNIDKFHIFVVKCIEKQNNYEIEIINNNTNLEINFIFIHNDFSINQFITFYQKILNDNELKTLEINKLKIFINELQKENEIIKTNCKDILRSINKLTQQNKQFSYILYKHLGLYVNPYKFIHFYEHFLKNDATFIERYPDFKAR